MSLQSDLVSALSAVASGRVYPQAAPADAPLPFVIYRVLNKRPEDTLNHSGTLIYTVMAFESYADDYLEALTLSASVESAIASSSLVYYKEVSPGENYEVLTDDFMEPVFYGFWHT